MCVVLLLCQVGTVPLLPPPPSSLLPVCVLASEGAKERQSLERISSVLTVDDPHGSCMLESGKAGLARLREKKKEPLE